jgi:WD40 repeat protein
MELMPGKPLLRHLNRVALWGLVPVLLCSEVACQMTRAIHSGLEAEQGGMDRPERLRFAGLVNEIDFFKGGHSLVVGGCQLEASSRKDACVNGVLQVWNVEKLAPEATIRLPRPITALAVSADGSQWVVGDKEGRLVFSNSSRKVIPKPVHQKTRINALAFSPDGKLVASGSLDSSFPLGFLDTSTGGMIKPKMHFDPVSAVAFSPDGRELAVGMMNGRLVLWNFGSQSPLIEAVPKTNENHSITSVTFSPEGRLLAYADEDGKVVIWGRSSATALVELKGTGVNALVFSPDGRYLALGQDNGKLLIIESESGHAIMMKRHVLPISDVAYSPDGRSLVVASQSNMYLYNLHRDITDVRTGLRAGLQHESQGSVALTSAPLDRLEPSESISSRRFFEVLQITQKEYMWLLPFDQILARSVGSMLENLPGTKVERLSTQDDQLLLRDGDRSLLLDLNPLKKAEGKSGLQKTVQLYESAQRFLLVSPGRSARRLEDAAVSGLLAEIGPGVRLIADLQRNTSGSVRPTPTSNTATSDIQEALFDGNIHYVRLAAFDRRLVGQVQGLMNSNQGRERYILDLRDNTGGSLEDAIALAMVLFPEGWLITEVVSRSTGDRIAYRSNGEQIFRSTFTVLVNERTAGSAEMLACGIRESGLGILVGVGTAGVDEFYTKYPLLDGSMLRVSSGRFYCPNGRSIRWDGQEVDIEIPNAPVVERAGLGDEPVNLLLSRDRQLKEAVTVARCLNRHGGTNLATVGTLRSQALRDALDLCQRSQF